jgi:phospholipase C
VGANQQFTAVLNYNNGTSKEATTAVAWSSSKTAVATIDNTGLATTLSSGSTTITATQGSISGSTGFTVAPPQCVTAPTGLVGWWTGDSDSVDLAGQNSGMLQNGGGFGSGEVGRGFNFTGNGASLLVNAAEYSPTAGTLMFWFLSTGGGSMTGSLVGTGNRAPGFSIDSNGNLVWEFGDLFGQSLGQVSANRWHHVALTYSTSGSEVSVVVYLDGSEVSTAIATPNLTWNPQVAFGNYLGTASTSFSGSMDEIAIFNQALSAQQIEQVYGAYSGGMCKPTLQGMSITPANPSIGPGASLQFTATGSYSNNSTHDLTSSAAWSSSNPAAATIGVTGLAIGVAPGVTTIGAALEGQNASTTLNVGPSLTSIQVTPPTPTIAVGTTQAFTATGIYSDGSQRDITTSVSWSTNPSVATISANGVATGVKPGQTHVVATVGTVRGAALLVVTSATLTGLTVSPPNPSIAAGTTQAFTASGTFSDGSTQDLTTEVQWSSSNSSVATINANGLATSFVAGQTSITATFRTASNSTVLTVTAAVLSSITITPANASLLVGSRQQFTATGNFSDNTQQNLTDVSVWSSSNQNVATITTVGLVSAVAAGATTVNATFNSVNGFTSLTVINPPPALVSISVSPSSSSVAVGFSQQFTALGTFSDGSTHDITSLVQWTSSAPTVATIGNTSGSYGLAIGDSAGGSTITASSGSVLGNASLTVTNAVLASVTVNPPGSVIPPGGSSQFTATGNFSDGTTSDLTGSVIWSSSSPAVATISNTPGSQGLATSTGIGGTRISAAYNSLLDSTTLTVQDQLVSITVVPNNALLIPGTTQQFKAIGTYLSGVQQDLTNQAAWTSSNPAVAVINSSGLALSASVGQTTIAAVLGSLTSDANLGVTPIQHVVLIVQENRTTDNLFQDPNLIRAGADIQNYGVNSSGQTIPLSQIDLGTTGNNPDPYDIGHTHADFVSMCDLNSATNTCKMDGADKERTTCNKTLGPCPPPPNPQFMYVNPTDVAPYFQMAEVYSFADRMFQTNQGPSLPAHQFIFAGTSAPSPTSNEFAADDPLGIASRFSGCVAPPAMYVEMINPSGVEDNTMYPCFEHATLSDLLDDANLSWRYYAPNVDGIWTAPTAINHMCVPNQPPPNGTQCTGADYTAASPKVVLEQSQSNAQILTDIASNQLAQVSWVMPPGSASDHAQSLGCGPSWVTSIVNAVGNSPYWSNTAIILTWDDWGGWYDHVPPPIVNDGVSWGSGYIYGFRVPLVVISPYAKASYISHEMHDFGSILKFLEGTFNLPSLGYADVKADDLGDIFQYSQAPLPFTQITPPLNNATCSADPSFTDPDND